LLSGEYAVLDGALALGVPTRLGQHLHARIDPDLKGLHYEALRPDGSVWFSAQFDEKGVDISEKNEARTQLIHRIFLDIGGEKIWREGWSLQTRLEFEPEWGLGSSSSWIVLLADWSGKDPFQLFFDHLSGSGCDVAISLARTPIVYRLEGPRTPHWEPILFRPPLERLWLHYVGQKQHSSVEVEAYRKRAKPEPKILDSITALTQSFAQSSDPTIWAESMKKHENLIANLTSKTPFLLADISDNQIVTKSLGAWGGDFVLILSKNSPEGRFTPGNGSFTLPFADWVSID